MKNYLFLLVSIFLLTACGEKEYKKTCTGLLDEGGASVRYNVTVKYNIEDKVKAIDYEMIYDNEEAFNKACEDNSRYKPTCKDLTIKYTETGDTVSNFKKDDVLGMLEIIGIGECK